MTQPLDKAFVEVVFDTSNTQKALDKDLTGAFRRLEQTATQSALNIEKEWKRGADRMSSSGDSVTKKLRDVTRTASAAGESLQEAFQAVVRGLGAVSQPLAGIVGGFSQLASLGPYGIAAAAAAFVVLAGAIAAAAAVLNNLVIIGAAGLATLPGLALAAAAGFAVFQVAISGVADAFGELTKEQKSGGASIAQSERQIAAAQRNIISAQRALNSAREDAAERIHDLRIELDRAYVSELRASRNVNAAERSLVAARLAGDPQAIAEAEVALQEAQQAQQEAIEKTRDLNRESAEANKKGVEGSDEVLAAKERLLAAEDALAAAQQRTSAGAGAQREAFNGLAKSAQEFVLALVSAQQQLGPVGKAIQEAFFAGTGPLIQPIVDNIKELQPSLVKVSAGFNKIFQEVLKFLGSDEAQEALGSILDGLAGFLDAVAPAIGPLLEAFAGLAGQAGEFGDELGGVVADALLGIADFVKNVDLKQLFKDAKTAINELLPVIKPLLSIAFDLFKSLLALGQVVLPLLTVALNGLAGIIKVASASFIGLMSIIEPVFTFIRDKAISSAVKIAEVIKNLPKVITDLGAKMLTAGKAFIGKLWEGLGMAGGFVADFSKRLANQVITFINNNVISPINRGIQAIEDGLNGLPFFSGVNLPTIGRIPGLEKGGIVTQEMLIRAGEKGKREGVIPLENPSAMAEIGQAIASAGGLGGSGIVFEQGSIVLSFSGATPSPAVARAAGMAVGEGIADVLARRGVRLQVRTR